MDTLALVLSTGVLSADIVISEIHYAPADKTVAEEFVELFNSGPDDVDLTGWKFTRGIAYTFAAGTRLKAKEFLVVAQSPSLLRSRRRDLVAVGPFRGRLSNSGERLELRDARDRIVDELRYGNRFPWPIVDRDFPSSIELTHANFDNALGGNWRRSGSGRGAGGSLIDAGSTWRYHKGTREPSLPGVWRRREFDDDDWRLGASPIGFGEEHLKTVLNDMRGAYSTLYLRRIFEVEDPTSVRDLVLEVSYDDGFVAWINGVLVASANVPSPELPYRGVALRAQEGFGFQTFTVSAPQRALRTGRNVLALQLLNSSLSRSSDAFVDLGLRSRVLRATPGERNSVHSESPPVHVRDVKSEPKQPRSGEEVTITAKVTSPVGIASVRLEYQIVEPGSYFGVGDREYATSWLSLPMRDRRTAAGVHEAILSGSLQRHRRLVRYRLVAQSDSGEMIRVPGPDDPEPNFAYFVHDGLPAWKGAVQPNSADPVRARVVSHGADALGRLPVYHLLTKKSASEDATWFSEYKGEEFRWRGTLVYDGEVYDHIGYRARGGIWRYAMGKNMWKFDFPRSHRFRARDNWGERYRTRWDKLNLSAVIQQADLRGRGEQGLFESVTYRLFNLAGVAAPKTHFVHLRIVDEAEEQGDTQYDGDFWGLYLAIEQMDGRFLDEHELPDGNLYKIERGLQDRNNLGPGGPVDGSDVREFIAGYLAGTGDDAWWRRNFDLDGYFSYRAVVEAVHHYDIGMGKNYFYYHNPLTERWSVLPWDVDLTWADHMFGNGRDPFYYRLLARPALTLEYRNRVREVRDLLFNREQTGRLIDEYAAMIDDPSGAPSMVDADRALWDFHPVMSDWTRVDPRKARPGLFYRMSPTGDFAGMARLMKNYVESRGRLLDRIALDPAIPQTPRVTSIGPAGHPVDALRFRASPFADPQGDDTFAALQWRLAEVTPGGSASFQPGRPGRYEAEAIWESGTIDRFAPEVLLRRDVATAGKTYRTRVRMMDDTRRWSHWSPPLEFIAGEKRR